MFLYVTKFNLYEQVNKMCAKGLDPNFHASDTGTKTRGNHVVKFDHECKCLYHMSKFSLGELLEPPEELVELHFKVLTTWTFKHVDLL